MTLEQRIVELEKRVAELEKAVQPEHIEKELAKRLKEAFYGACRNVKADEAIQYLRHLADESFTANFGIVGSKGTND